MEIVLASHNRRKAAELSRLLEGTPVEVRTLDDFPGVGEAVEDADTFAGNAARKALHALRATRLAALADDSGLEVDALGGLPGVRSARFAGEGAGDAANNATLLERLTGVPADRRTARFRSVVALAFPDGAVEYAEGSCEGIILEAPRGANGFGYDPLFLYPPLGRTFAELSADEKHRVSHRGMAMAGALRIIRARLAADP